MESNLNHQIKVGIFTLTGIILFCLSVILLGGDKMFFTTMYKLKVHLPQVQGLARGSVVTLSGLQVGNVDKVRFLENSTEVEVVMKIETGAQARITEGSMAVVKTQGALGDKYIYISPGPIGGKPLADGALLETDKTPDFLDVIASKGAEMGEIVEVIKEVRQMFHNINAENRSARLMNNLVDATSEIKSAMAEARDTFRIMRTETIQPLSSVLKKVDDGQGTLGALVNDPGLHERIQRFFGEVPRNRFLKPLIRESIQAHEDKR
jgi:phospholipid/cholesterol/gamma-HCH transport system substrate-binding protein